LARFVNFSFSKETKLPEFRKRERAAGSKPFKNGVRHGFRRQMRLRWGIWAKIFKGDNLRFLVIICELCVYFTSFYSITLEFLPFLKVSNSFPKAGEREHAAGSKPFGTDKSKCSGPVVQALCLYVFW
jgi:predicted nucleic-acid-binding Zn-ribbon protein